jgi:hypothetical protein
MLFTLLESNSSLAMSSLVGGKLVDTCVAAEKPIATNIHVLLEHTTIRYLNAEVFHLESEARRKSSSRVEVSKRPHCQGQL